MYRFTSSLLIMLGLGLATVEARQPSLALSSHAGDDLRGRPVGFAKAPPDTSFLLGGPGTIEGRFQTASGTPAWHGWTGVDFTANAAHHWSVTDDPALVCGGQRSLWLGRRFPAGSPWPGPGYGNDWRQAVVFAHTVADPLTASTVRWRLAICYDSEPGYDFSYLEYRQGGAWVVLAEFDGSGTAQFDETFVYAPASYGGPSGDRIELRVRFRSDGIFSDEDGMAPTLRGALQLDDIVVWVDGELIETEDFEAIEPDQPGENSTFGNWVVDLPGVGDFAALYIALQDLDPCVANFSPQVAFIDDGVVVPGTGGTTGWTWTYGPGGYVVNHSGGLLGGYDRLYNGVISPPLVVPESVDGLILAYDVYQHTVIDFSGSTTPTFDTWSVRSVDTGDPADLASAPWVSTGLLYFSSEPTYKRQRFDITPYLAPGRTHVQVALSARQSPSLIGADSTPAPYFDNVAVLGFPFRGPAISARAIHLFQDSFPASGTLDFVELGANSIRLDMASNISPPSHGGNTPGDSIAVDIAVIRAGFQLAGPPRLHFALKTNPLFDEVRDLSDPVLQGVTFAGGVVSGHVEGLPTYNAQGSLVPNRWNFDLPDAHFFFPGDILHYYIEAQDIFGDDSSSVGTTRLPADLEHFGDFDRLFGFDRNFTVRGLPTLRSAEPGDQPGVLWWDNSDKPWSQHFPADGGQDEWLYALAQLGYRPGVDVDLYRTLAAREQMGNSLGGRAAAPQLAGYEVLLVTFGDRREASTGTGRMLGVGDGANPADDIGLLTAWFALGSKKALLTGDNLAYELHQTHGAALVFRQDYLGVTYLASNLRPLIDNQSSPLVRPLAGNGVLDDSHAWIVYGGCRRLNTFDAVAPWGTAERLAGFTGPGGTDDPYPYAAAVRNYRADDDATIVYLPYDFMFIHQQAGGGGNGPVATRALVLQDILASFGQAGGSIPTGVAPEAVLAATNFPNPFNPSTTIRLTLPQSGEVGLKVFNLRGELVRTLVAGRLAAGLHEIPWDGTDDRGRAAASGVYFHELRAAGQTLVGKMVLVR